MNIKSRSLASKILHYFLILCLYKEQRKQKSESLTYRYTIMFSNLQSSISQAGSLAFQCDPFWTFCFSYSGFPFIFILWRSKYVVIHFSSCRNWKHKINKIGIKDQGKRKKKKEERKRKRKLRQKWCALGQHKINICSQEDDKLSSPWQRGETPTHTRGKCPIKAIKEAAIKGWPSWKLFKMQTVVFVIDDIFVCWSISSKSMTFLL